MKEVAESAKQISFRDPVCKKEEWKEIKKNTEIHLIYKMSNN